MTRGAIYLEYVISDPHLGHRKLRERTRQEFKTCEELAEHFVKSWNSVVTNNDIVYLLGDIGDRDFIKEYIPQLRGKIVAILGNHDGYSRKFYEEYFDYVYKKPFYINKRILLSHVPEPIAPGKINIHGHTHKIDINDPNYFNVCVDRVDYKPVKMKKFYDYLGTIEKPNIKFLEEWYADKQIVIEKREDLVTDENGLIDVEKSKIQKKFK